ncbi:hypothetical protein Cni_G25832 [Canna indica]|uniref:Uncharacterized protein n=1 Tax=Canna indica TaxID=4628 RepID=A0AAQ3KXR7_9LILI|nr:hypothetical protein Cni_G25832 [Canna indica]
MAGSAAVSPPGPQSKYVPLVPINAFHLKLSATPCEHESKTPPPSLLHNNPTSLANLPRLLRRTPKQPPDKPEHRTLTPPPEAKQ